MDADKTKDGEPAEGIHEEVGEMLTDLIDEGMMEASAIDSDGNFAYRLTPKGQKSVEDQKNIP